MLDWIRGWRRRRGPRDADDCLRKALLALLERDTEHAESLLAEAVKTDSGDFDSALALARFYRMRGEIGRAIRVHQNLLLRSDLDPEQTVAAVADLAADFRQGGFLQRAIASYEEVLERAPRHRGALEALVSLLADARDYDRALRLQRRLAKLERTGGSAEEARLRVDKAEAAWAAGRSDEARREAKRALRANPRSVRAWMLRGGLEAERGRSKAALAAWSKVPEIDRRSGALVYPRIESAYAALGRPREFESYLRGLLREREDDAHARLALARSLAARGEAGEAVAELRRLLERHPENLEGRGALGRLLLREHRDLEATKEYAELLDVLERRGLFRAQESLS